MDKTQTPMTLTTLSSTEAAQIAAAIENVLYALDNICPVSANELMPEDEYYDAVNWQYRLQGKPLCKKCQQHYTWDSTGEFECEWCERHERDNDDEDDGE